MQIGSESAAPGEHAESEAESFDWEAAMAASLAGDGTAYRMLLQQAARWLDGYYSSFLAPAMVEHAVQEALLALHARRQTYSATRPFLPWLMAIAHYAHVCRPKLAHPEARARAIDLGSLYAS